MKERKGFLTPNQEKSIDDLIEAKGMIEMFDGLAIKLGDNKGLELLKSKMSTESIEATCEVVDEILRALGIEP